MAIRKFRLLAILMIAVQIMIPMIAFSRTASAQCSPSNSKLSHHCKCCCGDGRCTMACCCHPPEKHSEPQPIDPSNTSLDRIDAVICGLNLPDAIPLCPGYSGISAGRCPVMTCSKTVDSPTISRLLQPLRI